jgi:hypothetical protein
MAYNKFNGLEKFTNIIFILRVTMSMKQKFIKILSNKFNSNIN